MSSRFNPRPNPNYKPGVNYGRYLVPEIPILRDLKYPLSIKDGGLETVVNSEITQQSIISVVETERGERVMRQDYGINNQLLSGILPGIVDVEIRRSILEQVDAIDELVTRGDISDLEDGTLRLEIYWYDGNASQPPINIELTK